MNEALPAGLPPVTWKSEKAACWLTQINPVRLRETGANTWFISSVICCAVWLEVVYAAQVIAPCLAAIALANAVECSVLRVFTMTTMGPKSSCW